jgi:hypothetical protein
MRQEHRNFDMRQQVKKESKMKSWEIYVYPTVSIGIGNFEPADDVVLRLQDQIEEAADDFAAEAARKRLQQFKDDMLAVTRKFATATGIKKPLELSVFWFPVQATFQYGFVDCSGDYVTMIARPESEWCKPFTFDAVHFLRPWDEPREKTEAA